ncbi:MAG: hypothetical protein F4Y79_06450 [Gemmatimonadetes bacterium]|nr:hypothetical protein [Gemmatimonadota bacterium]MYF17351.1 hypothetical protein [Gemmatimonadota bacterium]
MVQENSASTSQCYCLNCDRQLRTTFSDKQDDLLHAFKEFATQMADNNTKALIEALESVMRDFNAKINEQFGDNFKQLNEAVGRINDWQEQYRQQMDELAVVQSKRV